MINQLLIQMTETPRRLVMYGIEDSKGFENFIRGYLLGFAIHKIDLGEEERAVCNFNDFIKIKLNANPYYSMGRALDYCYPIKTHSLLKFCEFYTEYSSKDFKSKVQAPDYYKALVDNLGEIENFRQLLINLVENKNDLLIDSVEDLGNILTGFSISNYNLIKQYGAGEMQDISFFFDNQYEFHKFVGKKLGINLATNYIMMLMGTSSPRIDSLPTFLRLYDEFILKESRKRKKKA